MNLTKFVQRSSKWHKEGCFYFTFKTQMRSVPKLLKWTHYFNKYKQVSMRWFLAIYQENLFDRLKVMTSFPQLLQATVKCIYDLALKSYYIICSFYYYPKSYLISRLYFGAARFNKAIVRNALRGAVTGWRTSVAQRFFFTVLNHTTTGLPEEILKPNRHYIRQLFRFFQQLLDRIRVFFLLLFFLFIIVWSVSAVIAGFDRNVFWLCLDFIRGDSQEIVIYIRVRVKVFSVSVVGHHDSLPGRYRVWFQQALSLYLVGEEPGRGQSSVVEVCVWCRWWGHADTRVDKVRGVLWRSGWKRRLERHVVYEVWKLRLWVWLCKEGEVN